MNLSSTIKSKALEIGFSKIGIAKADFYKSDKNVLFINNKKIEKKKLCSS